MADGVDTGAEAAGGFLRWRRHHALPPGTGCYNCGGWSGGAVAGAAAVGVAAGVAVGAAAAATPAYVAGDTYAVLPAGCVYTAEGQYTYYNCNGTWYAPAYGANGTYYYVVPAPF